MTLTFRRAGAVAAILASLACSPGPAAESNAVPGARTSTAEIEHVVPAHDAVGAAPKRFEWTPFEGAESYYIVVVSEVDALVFEAGGIKQPFVDVPSDIKFDYGTYFWRVVAVRGNRGIAESGRAAFVVLE